MAKKIGTHVKVEELDNLGKLKREAARLAVEIPFTFGEVKGRKLARLNWTRKEIHRLSKQ